jgi:hypothetical protein
MSRTVQTLRSSRATTGSVEIPVPRHGQGFSTVHTTHISAYNQNLKLNTWFSCADEGEVEYASSGNSISTGYIVIPQFNTVLGNHELAYFSVELEDNLGCGPGGFEAFPLSYSKPALNLASARLSHSTSRPSRC